MDVSIVLPVYNEELSIDKELNIITQAMEKTGCSYEIIVVNDGSTDKTPEILLTKSNIRLLCNSVNKGVGAARKIGTRQAQGEIVVWTDVDLTYPNEKIPLLIAKLKAKNYDQVIGSRDSEYGGFKYLRLFIKWIIRKMVFLFTGSDIPDLNSGLRIFKREMALPYLDLLPRGFSCTSTATLIFICNGYSVGYYPIEYRKRTGRSKFNPAIDTYRCIRQIMRIIIIFKKKAAVINARK